jgi:hypothetical protein
MPRKVYVACQLNDEEWGWLTTSAANSGLPDEGKAFRCCVNFLAQDSTHVVIGRGEAATNRRERPIELAASQIEWMAKTSVAHGATSTEAFASAIVQACIPLDPGQVFGVIRCKTANDAAGVAGVANASTACAGAQKALAARSAAAAAAAMKSGSEEETEQERLRAALAEKLSQKSGTAIPVGPGIGSQPVLLASEILPLSFARCYWESTHDRVGCNDPPPRDAAVLLRFVREQFMECKGFWPTASHPSAAVPRYEHTAEHSAGETATVNEAEILSSTFSVPTFFIQVLGHDF